MPFELKEYVKALGAKWDPTAILLLLSQRVAAMMRAAAMMPVHDPGSYTLYRFSPF